MKKIILILFLLLSVTGKSQVKIQMQKDGGVYKVPCEVNGLRMKFIFDTGASDVCISLTEAAFMLENDYITEDDIIGNSQSKIADGSIVENTRIRLKEIKIGGLVLRNVEAVVIHNFGAPLLLGQSAIQKLGTIQIVGNELTILEHDNNKSYEEIDRLFEEADNLYDRKLFTAAARKYQELYNLNALSDYGIYLLARCYDFSENYEQAIVYFNKVKDFTDIDKGFYHYLLGDCYRYLDYCDDAIYHYELQSVYEEDATAYFGGKFNIAIAYLFCKNDFYKAESCFKELLDSYVSKKGYSFNRYYQLRKEGKVSDKTFDKYIFYYYYSIYYQSFSNYAHEKIKELARYGNEKAIKFLMD
ncbi:MAG: retropepsin-like aspartic protease [Bacteroidales bacterium]|nr:retropepsin-like aspartic protease [Bacteroidales bacterium]